MGKKDIMLKSYFSEPGRYADLFNGTVFQGKQVLRAQDLESAVTVQSKSNDQITLERIHDMSMKQTKDGSLFAVWVIANQEQIDYSIPVRVMLQEALEYDRQLQEVKRKNRNQEKMQKGFWQNAGEFLSKMKQKDRLRPVITLVVYWGEENWQGSESLHDIIDFGEDAVLAEELKQLVPEYPLLFLNLSQTHDYHHFQTELKTLFELYDRRNDKTAFRAYLEEHEECRQMNVETYEALKTLTNAQELTQYRLQDKEETTDMCKAIKDLIADGRKEGRLDTLYELVHDNLLSIKDAATRASLTETAFSDAMKKAGY